jgi:hypothetical protein
MSHRRYITERYSDVNRLTLISHEGMVSGFPEQTVVRQESLVFCISKSSKGSREHELAHTVGDKGSLHGLCSWRGRPPYGDRREPQRLQPLDRMSVFAGNSPTQMLALMENLGFNNNILYRYHTTIPQPNKRRFSGNFFVLSLV